MTYRSSRKTRKSVSIQSCLVPEYAVQSDMRLSTRVSPATLWISSTALGLVLRLQRCRDRLLSRDLGAKPH